MRKATKSKLRVADARRAYGVASIARLVGCHPGHLSYILHGRRKANDDLRSRLARLGITTTVDGEPI